MPPDSPRRPDPAASASTRPGASDQAGEAVPLPAPANDNARAARNRDMALLVIDVQAEFCDPSSSRGSPETGKIAQNIARLTPVFRRAGIAVYAIHYVSYDTPPGQPIDWFRFQPANDDIIIAKRNDSAFYNTNLANTLRRNGHRRLLACGFNLNACVNQTVMDARRHKFSVTLLRDLCGNDQCNADDAAPHIRAMKKCGVAFTSSAQAIRHFTGETPPPDIPDEPPVTLLQKWLPFFWRKPS